MNSTLKLSMLVALALGSTQAFALQLGQVQVKSTLGQPLLAEIPLRASSADELKGLSVRLASSEAFTRAGIAGGRTNLPLQFSVVSQAGGQKFIKITSATAVDNPYLDLLLEVNGHAGKSMREVAILLDPASGNGMAAPLRSAAAAPRKPYVSESAHTSKPSRSAVTPSVPSARKGQYGPVQKGQNLSSIARETALPGVDMAQMLLAYKQANPDAFYHDNINALKSGAVLRVPTAAQAQSTALATALAEVRRENGDWRAGTTSKPVTVADAGTGSRHSSSPSQSGNDLADRLALVPAKDGHGAGSAGSATSKSSGKLHQDLLRSQENIASLQQQSDDLKSRLKALSDINNNNTHLLSLKDSEIAQLQTQLASARKAAHLPPQPAIPPSSAANQGAPALAGSTAGTSIPKVVAVASAGSAATAANVAISPASAASASRAVASMPAAAAPVRKSAPMNSRPARHVPQPAVVTEQPWYMQTWAWAAAGGAVLVLLLLALMGRRRKPVKASQSGPASLADRFDAGHIPPLPMGDGADVDQDELLDQLAEHPEDVGLHLELVTLYYSRRDVEHFEAAAEAMYAHITSPQQDEWQDVLHMGEDLVPGHPLFDQHEELPVEEAQLARSSFDIDEYARDEETPAEREVDQAPKSLGEYRYNFNLNTSGRDPQYQETPPETGSVEDAVSVPSSELTQEHFLVEPEQGIADTSWNLDGAEHVPHETAELVAPAHHEALTKAELEPEAEPEEYIHSLDEFSDDPVDTKLDLARAYLDMGDAEGAQAMLGEVMREGTQMQRDTAKALLEKID